MDPIDRNVGARIRARRIEARLTQQALSEALGVSAQQVQKYETGQNRVSASKMYVLAKTLSVEPAYFFETSPALPGSASTDPLRDTRDLAQCRRLNEAFLSIANARLRRSIIDLVENVARSCDAAEA